MKGFFIVSIDEMNPVVYPVPILQSPKAEGVIQVAEKLTAESFKY